jgi:CubicO group peptidase (beta-lactamase class C family)
MRTLFPGRFLSRLVLALVLAVGLPALLSASAPGAAGFDPVRLARLDGLIQQKIDEQRLAGAVLYVVRDDEFVRLKPFGAFDREAGAPMGTDAIFRIASMSKAVTTVAVMMLYEEGRFLLNDPVSRFLPAFRNPVVAEPAPAGSPAGTRFVTVPARRAIRIRDLLTHTAGLTYGDGLAAQLYKEARLEGWYFADRDETIGEAVNRLAKLPLHGHPGESWQYGYATDVLGHMVEVISGMPLDRFIEERIARPLRMVDTCFFLPRDKAGRLAPVYGYADGKLTVQETSANSHYVNGPRKCFSGGAGLLSTAPDYGRFLRMLLNGGELEGVRLLAPRTVELMRQNHTGSLYRRDTSAFGLGFWVNEDPGAYGELSNRGAYGWGSAYFPQYLIDPEQRMVALLMTQLRPTGGLDLNQTFKVMLYQALKE